MVLKLDHWSCNLLAFDGEYNVLLCKNDVIEMAVVIQDVI